MHQSVLLDEAIDRLVTDTSGIYVDATFGGGGHTRALLKHLSPNAQIIAFDKDATVFANNHIEDRRLSLCHKSFADIQTVMNEQGIDEIQGVLADFGVSSMQLDTAERGFSFRYDAPLDMRMNQTAGLSAATWINTADEQEIAHILYHYGEEKKSRAIAKAIVSKRAHNEITRTTELADVITQTIGKYSAIHPATQSFQAIRMHINNELAEIQTLLNDAWQLLRKGGRLVCISFHSLEDRLVKQHFAHWAQGVQLPSYIPIRTQAQPAGMLIKKCKASKQEVMRNPRARSAVLRAIEKTKSSTNNNPEHLS